MAHDFYNGSGASVVVDAAGHVLDSGDHYSGGATNPILVRLVAAGLLTDLGDVSAPEAAPEVAADPPAEADPAPVTEAPEGAI